MKLLLSLAAAAALFVAFQSARAVEDPPEPHLLLVEVEQQTPYLESFAGVSAGTATISVIRRVGATAEVGGQVPATLALSLGAAPTFGAFQPGVEKEYTRTGSYVKALTFTLSTTKP